MIDLPASFSIDELAALSVLTANEPPPYLAMVGELPKGLVESGMRSLYCRRLLSHDGERLLVNDGAIRASSILSRMHSHVSVGQVSTDSAPAGLRLVRLAPDIWLAETPGMTGVVDLSALSEDGARTLVSQVTGVSRVMGADATAVRDWPGLPAVLRDGAASGWDVLQVVQVVEVIEGRVSRGATWVSDPAGLWSLGDGSVDAGVSGVAATLSEAAARTVISDLLAGPAAGTGPAGSHLQA